MVAEGHIIFIEPCLQEQREQGQLKPKMALVQNKLSVLFKLEEYGVSSLSMHFIRGRQVICQKKKEQKNMYIKERFEMHIITSSQTSGTSYLLPYCCLAILHCCVAHACLPRTCNTRDQRLRQDPGEKQLLALRRQRGLYTQLEGLRRTWHRTGTAATTAETATSKAIR